jgi:ribosomal protein S18 acetylase RimI-like enzyme
MPKIYLPAGMVCILILVFNICHSLKKTISLYIQIISLPTSAIEHATGPDQAVLHTVRPAMASDVAEVATLLGKEFCYVYEALFEASPSLTVELLRRLLAANDGNHNLGYRSFFVAMEPSTQAVIGIMLLSPPRKYGWRELKSGGRFMLTLLRYLGIGRVFRVLRNIQALATIVPLSAAKEMNVSYIAVIDGQRRKSVGTSLLKFAISYAEGLGSEAIRAEIRDQNSSGLAFFKHNGFGQVAVLKSASDSVLSHGSRILVKRNVTSSSAVVLPSP